jgi:hypothetical protein
MRPDAISVIWDLLEMGCVEGGMQGEFEIWPREEVGDCAVSVEAGKKPPGREGPDGLPLDDEGGVVYGDEGAD